MTQTFEQYVDEWDKLVADIEALNEKAKPLKVTEMTMRKAIADSIKAALADKWKEGTNSFPLQDGRVLNVVNKVDRNISTPEVANAREEYRKLNSAAVAFDDLLRVKYDLDKANWNKLDEAAALAVSRMIETKPKTPEVKFK